MGSFTLLPVNSALGMTPSTPDRRASRDGVSHFNVSYEEVFHLLLWSTGMLFRLLPSTEKTEGSLGLSEASHPKSGVCWLSSTYLPWGNTSPKLCLEVAFLRKPDLFLWESTMAGSCCQFLLLSLELEHYQQVYGLLMPCWGLLILSGSWYLKEWLQDNDIHFSLRNSLIIL